MATGDPIIVRADIEACFDAADVQKLAMTAQDPSTVDAAVTKACAVASDRAYGILRPAGWSTDQILAMVQADEDLKAAVCALAMAFLALKKSTLLGVEGQHLWLKAKDDATKTLAAARKGEINPEGSRTAGANPSTSFAVDPNRPQTVQRLTSVPSSVFNGRGMF